MTILLDFDKHQNTPTDVDRIHAVEAGEGHVYSWSSHSDILLRPLLLMYTFIWLDYQNYVDIISQFYHVVYSLSLGSDKILCIFRDVTVTYAGRALNQAGSNRHCGHKLKATLELAPCIMNVAERIKQDDVLRTLSDLIEAEPAKEHQNQLFTTTIDLEHKFITTFLETCRFTLICLQATIWN